MSASSLRWSAKAAHRARPECYGNGGPARRRRRRLGAAHDTTKTHLKWFVAEYPRLAVRPYEVVQEAGDVVFVPAGWGHAVLNLEPSVAVAFELGFPSLNDDPNAPTHGYMVVDLPA